MKKKFKAVCFLILVCWLIMVVSGCQTTAKRTEPDGSVLEIKLAPFGHTVENLSISKQDARGNGYTLDLNKGKEGSAADLLKQVAAIMASVPK